MDDMKLPEGKIAKSCVHFKACNETYGCKAGNTSCDFSPSRFVLNKTEQLKAQNKELLECLVELLKDCINGYPLGELIVRKKTWQSYYHDEIKLIEKHTNKPIEEVL
jgi:hypothetical protein